MRTPSVRLAIAALVLLPLGVGGCGSESTPGAGLTVPVKGTVRYKGKPLTEGTVLFEPEGAGREAHGDVQRDGTFVLSTYKDGDGAVKGTHRVAVTGTPKVGKEAVPVKFKSTSSSKVTVDVSDGKTDYDIEFK